MRVMIVGSGAREQAMAWCALRSPLVQAVLVAPGNAGTTRLARQAGPAAAGKVAANVALNPMEPSAVAAAARQHGVDLAIVASDDPLAAGVVDGLQEAGVRAFGPTRAAAEIESSKVWSKQFMRRHGIATAPFEVFEQAPAAHRFVDDRARQGWQLVVKADGLARGKGVIVCDDAAQAHAAVDEIMEQRVFGAAGTRIVIERRMVGEEASVFALCDGQVALPMGAARDHKRIFEGERGPNTGGMGAYSPTQLVTPAVNDQVFERVIRPAVLGMAAEGRPFAGFLYAGVIFTADGIQVVEFNARFGDPEAQVILPLLKTDLIEAVEAALEGKLSSFTLDWHDSFACAVCLASSGYPGTVQDGVALDGLDDIDIDATVFHSGTAERAGQLVTSGGRVVTVVGLGESLTKARAAAYRNAERVRFHGKQYRRDIGLREESGQLEQLGRPVPT